MIHATFRVDAPFQARTIHRIAPDAKSERLGEARPHIVLHLHAREPAKDDGGKMRRAGRVGITVSWSAPQRLMKRKGIGGRVRTIVRSRRIPSLFFAANIYGIDPSYSSRHGEQLPQRDVSLARIVERKYLRRHVFRREYLLIETLRNQ